MAYPDSPSSPRCQPSADKPDWLLTEPHEAHLALAIAEHRITLWRANSATRGMPLLAYRSYAAHEALHEAGGAINRIAEVPRIEAVGRVEAAGTLTTQHLDHSAQIYTEASPTEPAMNQCAAVTTPPDNPGGVE